MEKEKEVLDDAPAVIGQHQQVQVPTQGMETSEKKLITLTTSDDKVTTMEEKKLTTGEAQRIVKLRAKSHSMPVLSRAMSTSNFRKKGGGGDGEQYLTDVHVYTVSMQHY